MIENTAMNFTNITLFVPSDEAFEVMDRERLERLISNEDCVEVSLLMIIDKPIAISLLFHDVTESPNIPLVFPSLARSSYDSN